MSLEIAKQYERWPYPDIPLFASISREQLWQINLEWMLKMGGLPLPAGRAAIWITGCGTFQPYLFSQANPSARILATDISKASLKKARSRCLFHLNRNVEFHNIDLEREEELPKVRFDLIECYGVLMNLKDPDSVLKGLAKCLKENGILRVMVYPHYSRQHIFQIQRLAKLLGLSPFEKDHPKKLRVCMEKLPPEHILKKCFFSYADSKNDSGIVDGFLHGGDRAFTGTEICKLIEAAGLSIAYTMHRPWGDPRRMAIKQGLEGKDAAYLLNYLDVWGRLRSNFILCLKHRNTTGHLSRRGMGHPLFSLSSPGVGIRHRARLLRMCLTGARLQTRTYDGALDLGAPAIRRVLLGESCFKPLEKAIVDPSPESPLEPLLSDESRGYIPSDHWVVRQGEGAPSPLFAHYYDTSFFKHGCWEVLAQDLENDSVVKGIPPAVTSILFPEAGHLLTNEQQRAVYKFIDNLGITRRSWEKHELLELWYLLMSGVS